MIITQRSDNQLINNINLNVGIINILEILYTPKWVDRKCTIQKDWWFNYKFIEYSSDYNMDVYMLINKVNCFINLQQPNQPQIAKNVIESDEHIPQQLCEFVLSEPILSLGTTNLMWSNDIELNSLNNYISNEEKRFIMDFFDKTSLEKIINLIDKENINNVSRFHFDILLNCVEKNEIPLEFFQDNFGLLLNKEQHDELLDSGLTLSR